MKAMKLKSLLLALPLALPMGTWADDHHAASPSFKAVEVAPSITMLQGRGGNIGVLSGEQGLVLIDDDYGVMSEALTQKLKTFGGAEKITYIINTHWHGDHTEGNLTLGKHAPIVAHDNVRQRLLSSQEVKLFGMVTEPYPEIALPSVTYLKTMNLYINNEQLQLIHLPDGHTDGDSVVHFKRANVMHLGDHFFNGMFPFVDVQNGGNVLKVAKNLESILPLINDKTVIIPGHGPLATQAELLEFIDMLKGTSAEVEKMKKDGLSLEEMQAAGLSKRWDKWSKGFINPKVWIGIVYASSL